MTSIESEDKDEPTGGTVNLDGLDYQLSVSIWAALDLMLDKRVAPSLVLEPVSQEDIEANIADEHQPGAMVTRSELDTAEPYLLVIQAKVRNTEPWEHEGLLKLLKHGIRRTSADLRLRDPHVRYLLVTNAALKGVARSLQVGAMGEWPSVPLPPTLKNGLTSSPDGRVGVLAGTSKWAIDRHVRELLEETFRVPHTSRQNCERALQDAARARMNGAGDGVWRREDLEKVVREHGGYLTSSPEVDAFVRPTHWTDLERTLRERYAIVLLGTSGTGKTTAAQVMIDGLRGEVPGLAVVRVSDGRLDSVMAPRTAGPVVFHIEDPWGKYKLDPASLPWNETLGRLLSTADGNRQFIVTSRSDIFNEAGLTSPPVKYIQHLEVKHYGWDERVRMYEHRSSRMPWLIRRAAVHHRDDVLEKLLSPLEIQRFFDALGDGPRPEEDDRALVDRCCEQAHRDTIEQTIVLQIRMRGAWDLAVIVWGLLKARPSLPREQIPRIRAMLADTHEAQADELEPFVRFLIAGHNLRQIESEVRYAHPSVEAALEQALKHKPSHSSRLLRTLVQALARLDDAGGDWGGESAANLMRATKSLADLSVVVDVSVQATVDAWLVSRLAISDERFSMGLHLAAEVGSEACIPARLARWLLHTDPGSDAWFGQWSPLPVPPAWYAEVAADPLTPHICERFVRSILRSSWTTYSDQFAEHMLRLAPDLPRAFLGAAEELLVSGGNWNVSVIARGCVGYLAEFAAVAVQASGQLEALDGRADYAEQLRILNGEYDEEFEEHLSQTDEGGNARLLLSAYVEAARRRDGWEALGKYAQRAPFRRAWLDVVTAERGVSSAEAFGLMAVVQGTAEEAAFWLLLADYWHPALESQLVARVQLQHGDDIRIATLVCLARHCPQAIASVAESLCQAQEWRRVLESAHDLSRAWSRGRADQDALKMMAARFHSALPPTVRAIAEALFCPPGGRSKLGHESIEFLRSVDVGANLALLLAQSWLLADVGDDVTTSIDVLLSSPATSSDDIQRAVHTVKLAAEIGHWPTVEQSLEHPFADVRQAAFEALAGRNGGPLAPELLGRASDPGNRVRFALVGQLEARRHPEHADALIVLAADKWEKVSRHHADESAEYPIARRAAKVLSEMSVFSRQAVQEAIHIARRTEDEVVRDDLLLALARNQNTPVRAQMLDFVLKPDAPTISVPMARALMRASDSLDEAAVNRIEAHHLEHARPSVATALAVIVGRRGASERVTMIAQALTENTQRRSLLFPLICFAVPRDMSLLERLVVYLPADRISTVRRALENSRRLPREISADFGDVHIVDEVLRLPDLFEPSE